MRRHLGLKLVLAHVGLLLGASCGLLDLASFKGVTFQLPKKMYSVSTMDKRWKAPPPTGIPDVTCGPMGFVPDCCMPAPGVKLDCLTYPVVCDTGKCALRFAYEIAQAIDLSKEVPDLKAAEGTVLSAVLLKTIEITINNSLNMPTPPVSLYVAPANVTSASDKNATLLGTVPSHLAGYMGTETLVVDAAAAEKFSAFAKDFKTPFNVLASTTIVVKGGSMTPSGKVDITLGGTVEAQF